MLTDNHIETDGGVACADNLKVSHISDIYACVTVFAILMSVLVSLCDTGFSPESSTPFSSYTGVGKCQVNTLFLDA